MPAFFVSDFSTAGTGAWSSSSLDISETSESRFGNANLGRMAIYRVKIRWSGFSGAPGYTVLHFDAATAGTTAGAQAAHDNARAFAVAFASATPSVVRLTLESGVEYIEQTTGELLNVFTVTTGAQISGSGAGGFSSATGACITWETGEVKNSRRVRGRTFIVPMSSVYYEADGTITTGGLTDLQEAAALLAGGGFNFGIWSRPSSAGAADGSFHTVSTGRVTDKTAILRNRRD